MPAATVQYAFSLALFTIAFSTLVYGPASDRYGRRPVLVIGLVIFVLGSAIAVIAPSIEIMILGRIIQAVGARREWFSVVRLFVTCMTVIRPRV